MPFFYGASILFSIEAVPNYIPTNSVVGFKTFTILSAIYKFIYACIYLKAHIYDYVCQVL